LSALSGVIKENVQQLPAKTEGKTLTHTLKSHKIAMLPWSSIVLMVLGKIKREKMLPRGT